MHKIFKTWWLKKKFNLNSSCDAKIFINTFFKFYISVLVSQKQVQILLTFKWETNEEYYDGEKCKIFWKEVAKELNTEGPAVKNATSWRKVKHA